MKIVHFGQDFNKASKWTWCNQRICPVYIWE